MQARTRAGAAAWALLGLLAACSTSSQTTEQTSDVRAALERPASSTTTTSTTTAVETPMADPAEPGPHPVGRSTFTLTDDSRDGRALDVDVWYPAVAGAAGEPSSYLLPGEVPVTARALDDPPAAEGWFPLVVFSHANAGSRFQSFSLAESLAGHGFVVAAPDHQGSTVLDQIGGSTASFDEVAVDRPLDVSAVIDAMVDRSSAPTDALSGRIDHEAIGVVGHSMGGFSALAVAGGTDSVDADDRVTAAVAIAPMSSILSDDNLSAVDDPTLLVGGTADTTAPIDDAVTRPFALVGAEVRRVDVVRAAHWSFTDICQLQSTLAFVQAEPGVQRPFAVNAVGACGDDALPADVAKRLTSRYVVAFLRVHLAADDRYAPFLDPTDGAEVHVR